MILLLIVLLVGLIAVGTILFVGLKLRASLPIRDGEIFVAGLASPVKITFDGHGIPTIIADSRLDAMQASGYVTASDRLFQMDLLRRLSAGRLSEIFGKKALEIDKRQRVIGFNRAAKAIVAALEDDQKKLLEAYASGVNAFIEQISTPPFEFLLLRYRPQPWRMEDSILVLLNMFQTLTEHSEDDERMISIMEASLPQEVVAFLTPDTDVYTTVLLGGEMSDRPIQPIPVEALAKILRAPKPNGKAAKVKSLLSWGSNNWVVNQSKTADGRAIVANDMHLKLSIPNVWYRASLCRR